MSDGGVVIRLDMLLKGMLAAVGTLLLAMMGMIGWYLEDISDRLANIENVVHGLTTVAEIDAEGG